MSPKTVCETMTCQGAAERVLADYLEMPGLKLTASQIRRLCGISQELCEDATTSLVRARVLRRLPDGQFVLLDV